MPEEITIDGMAEEEFRRSIEAMLRHGQAATATSKLKELIAEHAGEGKILPERFLSITPTEIKLGGWDRLTERLNSYDREENPITALHVEVGDPEDAGITPDEEGKLSPYIETSFFSDSAYPFSAADRDDLLDGYTTYGCQWQGDYEQMDDTLSIEGLDDLYGSIVSLEMRVAQSENPSADDISAGALGACYLGVLIHQAVREAAISNGLPRPMCVMAGSSGTYPFFDAPVLTREEYCADGAVEEVSGTIELAESDFSNFDTQTEDDAEEPSAMASLESLVAPRERKVKKPVLVLEGDGAGGDYSPIPEEAYIPDPDDEFGRLTELDGPLGPRPRSSFPSPDFSAFRESHTPIDFGNHKKPVDLGSWNGAEEPESPDPFVPEDNPEPVNGPVSDWPAFPQKDDSPEPVETSDEMAGEPLDPNEEADEFAHLPSLPVADRQTGDSGDAWPQNPEPDAPAEAGIEVPETWEADQSDNAEDSALNYLPEADAVSGIEAEGTAEAEAPAEPVLPEESGAPRPHFDLEPSETVEDAIEAQAEAAKGISGLELEDDDDEGKADSASEMVPDKPAAPARTVKPLDLDFDFLDDDGIDASHADDLATDDGRKDSGTGKFIVDDTEWLVDMLGLNEKPIRQAMPQPESEFRDGETESEAEEAPPAGHPLRANQQNRAEIVESEARRTSTRRKRKEAVWRVLLPTLARWVDAITGNGAAKRVSRWFGGS